MSTIRKVPSIPWQQAGAFEEVALFFRTVDQVNGSDLAPVRALAREIRDRLSALASCIEALCRLSCPDCSNVCCRRATVWYEFKDLACLYFSGDGLPDQQIKKNGSSAGCSAGCIHLTDRGCSLPRKQRPFICTWYLCSDQKLADPKAFRFLSERLGEVKMLRNELESAFCRISAAP